MKNIISILLNVVGVFCIMLGLIGIFLPLLPTTPFLLISVSCFMKSSPRLYNWLISNRLLGQHIRNYYEKKGMAKKSKIVAITLLWTMNIYTVGFMVSNDLVKVVIILISVGVTWHISVLKNL